jgi:hypothetical protein
MSNYIAPSGESVQLTLSVDTNGTPVNPPAGPVSATVSPSFTVATGSFTVSAGYLGLSVANVGAASGVFDGTSLPSGATISFDVVQGATYTAVSGDATGTTFQIAKVLPV